MKTAILAAGAVPLARFGQMAEAQQLTQPREAFPTGKIGQVDFSRFMLGGNMMGGYAHSRDLAYVSPLMKRYHTEAKILETLEIAEMQGINTLNSPAWTSAGFLKKHWANGGKIKWIAQTLPTRQDLLGMFKKAVDDGATAVQIEGDAGESLLAQGRIGDIAKIIEFVKSQNCLAGVGAHGLGLVRECEKEKIPVDFYLKTLHTHDYFSAPKTIGEADQGSNDNYWCRDPEEVVRFMFNVKKPWIAFKVMAAGAIPPQRAFAYAFNAGADFVLAGMFDWQIALDAQIAREAFANLKRSRPWPETSVLG
jgi:hypothetical protein